jgi:cyclophilin family peptidyl-prolyl cis-trans isomerase
MTAAARPLVVLLLALVALTAAACGSEDTAGPITAPAGDCAGGELATTPDEPRGGYDQPEEVITAGCEYSALITTNFGDIEVALDQVLAPTTVNSFVFLATRGYFDGLSFHRVVPGFVIQGGDPTGTGSGGPGYTIPDELPAEPGYDAGAVAMANAGPNTSGSQFFIVTGDASFLPNAYSEFGRVTAGLEVARRIEGLADPAADPGDPAAQRPSEPALIESIRIREE